MIIKANSTQCKRIAFLHLTEIKSGFLASLGLPFLKTLYNFIIKKGILLVSADGDRIDGFVSFSLDTRMLMIGFVFSNPLSILSLLLNFYRNPVFLKKTLETCKAPFKSSTKNSLEAALPVAELLSIAVDSTIQKSGIGSHLLNTLEVEIKRIGIKEYKVIAGADLESANKFYLKNGFILVRQIIIHGNELSNIYLKKL